MTRVKTWGGVVACAVLVAAVWVAGRIAPNPVPATLARAVPAAAPSPVEAAGPGSELAIFQEAVLEWEQIRLDMAPPAPGTRFVFAPNSSRKGEAKREIQIAKLTAKAFAALATAHGLSYEELRELVARGEAEGWPRFPEDRFIRGAGRLLRVGKREHEEIVP